MTSARGTTNTNVRGSAQQRRRRKQLLLDRDGDGVTAPCWECQTHVTFQTMVCDRIKPGVKGGSYGLDNVRVHCAPCSEAQGRRMSTETRRWKSWERRGLHRTRVSPAGFRTPGRWHIELDGEYVGYVEMWFGGGWRAFQDRPFRVAGGGPTMREALYALLVEHTTPKRVAA